ncbi:MAG: PilZ domain-containing protein [Deltaproteobacteria bacterium]|uniref:PilZ domain-containing protein n=1 Tax=Desulfobacula sp. TaxID=2593537 RepID=UPI00198DDC6C|nr:PilZ domain-containing protein [Candidatus Desulfobacula maris]MBL6995490.1 PilZ domain-containing protein [Desulfobacula sp.]
MMDGKRTVEKRKNKRYKAVHGSYAAINHTSRKMGPIIDISMGGLAFKYTDAGSVDPGKEPLEEKTISLSNLGYYVGNIPFKTISEKQISTIPSFTFGSMKIKIKQIQFKGLDFKQMIDLDHFVRNNVSEKVEKLSHDDKS